LLFLRLLVVLMVLLLMVMLLQRGSYETRSAIPS
jgi:preprotein translocase subunit SecG